MGRREREQPAVSELPEFPHDLDAERALLGALLLYPERFPEVADEIAADDFYRDGHRKVYAALLRLQERREKGDLVAARAELERAGELEAAGGVAYLAALIDGVPRSSLDPAAVVVRDRSLRRDLIKAAHALVDQARSAETAQLALEEAEASVYTLATRVVGGSELVDSKRMAREAMDLVERLQSVGGISGLSTGLADLDSVTRGMHASQLIILAARPGMGKSALAQNIAEHVASTVPMAVALFSLEMAREEIALRRVALRSRVSNHRINGGMLYQTDYGKIAQATGEIEQSRLWVDDSPERTVSQIRSICRRLKSQHGLGLAVVDYLQLLTPPLNAPRGANREQHVASFSRGLKKMAKELRCPVLALSQLSRESEDRKGGIPKLSDLRESGSLEQDADAVWFVHPPSTADGTALLIVAKQRNGPRRRFKVAYDPASFWFGNLARGERDDEPQDDDAGADAGADARD